MQTLWTGSAEQPFKHPRTVQLSCQASFCVCVFVVCLYGCSVSFMFQCVVGDVAQLVEHRTGTLLTQVRFPGAARDFSPRINFQCRLAYGVCTPPRGITCINICAHIKDCVLHVRVQLIVETLKHPACTIGWVAQLCRSWLSPGKATQISHWRNPIGTIRSFKKKSKCKVTIWASDVSL